MAPGTGPDPRLFLALDRAAHRVREQLEVLCQARLGVSAAQFGALLHLARQDGARAGDLAAALGVQPAAVTGLADRMIAAGLVRRRPDPEDARVQRLYLTAAGRRAADGGRGLVAAANAALAKRFTAEELAVVARFLADVRAIELEPPGETS
jgi:MarR family transcriptional regulator, organic hydroperoxide resistance regulator